MSFFVQKILENYHFVWYTNIVTYSIGRKGAVNIKSIKIPTPTPGNAIFIKPRRGTERQITPMPNCGEPLKFGKKIGIIL